MAISSLKSKLFPNGNGHADPYALVERITSSIYSSVDINDVLKLASGELGRALDAGRLAVTVFEESPARVCPDYHAPDLELQARELLRSLDPEVSRIVDAASDIIEIGDTFAPDAGGHSFSQEVAESLREVGIRALAIAPIKGDGQTIGAIVGYWRAKRRLSDKERQLIRVIAANLGLAIYHIRLQEKAKSAADREALTNRLLTAIRSAVVADGVLKVAVEGLGDALGVTRAIIYMHASRRQAGASRLLARAEYRSSVLVPTLLGTTLDVEGSPIIGQLLAGELITINDTNESHPVVRAIGVRLGVRALALAPISYNGQTVATLALEQFDRPREFSQEEIRLIRLVAEQTAVALYQADLYREAQEAARREALISRISSAIHSSLDPDTVLETIVSELGAALAVCRCRLALLPDPMPEFIPITHDYTASCCSARPPAMEAIPSIDNEHLQAVLASMRPMAVDDVQGDKRLGAFRDRFRRADIKSLLVAAIRLGGRPIGIFSLHHCEQQHSWTDWEMAVVESVAEQAAVAIRQAELYREARESATGAALVNQIVASIRRSLDVNETLQVAVEELGRALGANRTYFRKVIGEDAVVVAEHLSDPALSVRHVRAAADDYIASYLSEKRRTLILDDVRQFKADNPALAATVRVWQTEPPNLSQIICPIFVSGQFWGALTIAQTDRQRKWTSSEIALVEGVTAQVEVAVSHSHLFEEAKRAAQLEALVSHIIHGINQSNSLDEIFPVIARELGEHLVADRLAILMFDHEARVIRVACEYLNGDVSRPELVYPLDLFPNFRAIVEDGLVRSEDVVTDPRFEPYRDVFAQDGTRAFMATYLYSNDAPRLGLAATMKTGPRRWTDEEAQVMRAAADQMLIALQRAELFEQVSRGKYEWEATFDALTDGILIFDQHGRLRRVNEAGAAFEMAEVRDLIGRRCCTLLEGIEAESCRVAEVIRTGRPVTFELVPERLKRPVLVTMSPLLGEQGEREGAAGAVCIVRDLSELRAAEAVAREQRGFLVKLIEHANDAISALSPEGQIIWFNEQLTALSGYSREELVASHSRQFLAADDKRVAVERFNRALAGQAQTFEMHAVRKNGERRLLLVTYTPIYDEGRVTSVLSIARDVTEERLASERAAQADKLRALGQLASGVAHNFNNILAAVLGHAQLVKRDCRDDRTAQRIEIIERAALDGAQTVKRIQSFGLQQNGEVYESVDLNQIIQDSTNLTRARWRDDAQARGLSYDVEVELEPVPLVVGAASELREVFVNIILNALDAMPQGGRLKITTERAGAVVRTSFTDSGVGMSREVCDHIFEPFFTTKGVTGMGLGLAVSYSIIERHGGRIEAHSNPGRGSTFTVTLPVAGPARKTARKDLSAVVDSASILVVDDDERVRTALAGMLSSAGHRAEQAASGPQALEKMKSDRFDLVFTDLSMPEMDGWAVASEIRRNWPEVKIVLITGYALGPETVKHRRSLVNEVIFKPIRFDDISATLSQVLS
ncbi:MAG TPA: GAF domain-containing protein [Blastocatellia bacterium]|nr:GAF domain-containing protein [Blastocatellia bacterium]